MKAKTKKDKFLDLKLPVFYNKRNGQMLVCLPKKKIKKKIKYVRVRWK